MEYAEKKNSSFRNSTAESRGAAALTDNRSSTAQLMQLKSKVNINADVSLEKEADVMGTSAASVGQRMQTGDGGKSLPVQRVAAGGVIQRVSVEEDIEELRKVKNTSDDPLLKKILNEVLSTLSKPTTKAIHGPSQQTSHMGPVGEHGKGRKHEVVVDPKHYPEDVFRQSILLHETVHASADKKYAFNAKDDTSAYNIVYSSTSGKSSVDQYKEQVPVLQQVLIKLKVQVQKERDQLGVALADHMIDRINRAIPFPMQEFDTVVSELYYYLRVKHPQIKTGGTQQQLHRAAGAAYKARNGGKTVKETYTKDLPELKVYQTRWDYGQRLALYSFSPKDKTLLPEFEKIKKDGVKALESSTGAKPQEEYKRLVMRLLQVQLKAYGNQAEKIAKDNGLDMAKHQLTYLDWRMDIYGIKAWRHDAKQKLDNKWIFTKKLTTAVAGFDTIINAFGPMIVSYDNFEKYVP